MGEQNMGRMRGAAMAWLLVCGTGQAAESDMPDVAELEGYERVYLDQCAVCHGERLEGAAQGTPLAGVTLKHGDSVEAIAASIGNGFPEKGMPRWSASMDDAEIHAMALYISETRSGLNYDNFNYSTDYRLPEGIVASERHAFVVQTVIEGLDPLPYSIAPLPDGRLLLTEKKRGLSIISANGEQSPYIEDAPRTYDDTYVIGVEQEWGFGWMLDVALHPNYADNGWIYIHYGDRCSNCNAVSRKSGNPVGMNKVVRGRIEDGRWIDQEVIWQVDKAFYGSVPDIGAGGRLAFDDEGHLFISVGIRGGDNHTGVQDLSKPWGKIHRVNDDGSIPFDNPFVNLDGAVQSIWTYGHRSPQGLEFCHLTGDLWGTEHGPRGGDELNRLLPGRNYGWPLYSKGLNYDGTPVAYGKKLGIEFDLEDIEQPVVDLSPSPAVSSFVFYTADAFPGWRNNIIVGALKARSLYRMEVRDNVVVHTETLLSNLARFRDIEVGPQGELYILLEHNSGGRIVRLVPAGGVSAGSVAARPGETR